MALTVNLKPSGFRPVGGGELIYKFTEGSIVGKPNYRVELEFNGLGLPKFEFRPDAALVIECDIAPILRSVLLLSTATADRLKNTYVMYQAVWTGGSDAQVALNTDVIYFFVGNNHYLNNRSKFHITAADNKAGPPFGGGYPTGVSLLYEHPSAQGSSSYQTTENIEMIGWLGQEFVLEFLHDNTLGGASESGFKNPSGGTIGSLVFDGTVYGLRQNKFTPNVTGQWVIYVFDSISGNYTYFRRLTILEPPDNAVYLQWINDYGGLERRLFGYSQDDSFSIGANSKYVQRRLFAEGLRASEWYMLNELIREGQIYNDSRRIGQFVQDITDLANAKDVIVTPTTGFRRTRQLGNRMSLDLRYGAIPNNEVT